MTGSWRSLPQALAYLDAATSAADLLARLVEVDVDADAARPGLADAVLERGWDTHASWEVRARVASMLMIGADDAPERFVEPLVTLARDRHPKVRDWATMALANVGLDSAQVRAALAERLGDDDDETRGEALLGLAELGDGRAVEHLRRRTDKDTIWTLELRAAAVVADVALHAWICSWEDDWLGDEHEKLWVLARDRTAPDAEALARVREQELLAQVLRDVRTEGDAILEGSYPRTRLVVTWTDGRSWDAAVWPDAWDISWASYEPPGSLRWRDR